MTTKRRRLPPGSMVEPTKSNASRGGNATKASRLLDKKLDEALGTTDDWEWDDDGGYTESE